MYSACEQSNKKITLQNVIYVYDLFSLACGRKMDFQVSIPSQSQLAVLSVVFEIVDFC